MIIEQIQVTSMDVFCYLVADDKTREGVLIDPAGDHDLIFNAVKSHGVKVKYIINTHGHFDHTSGNSEAAEKTGAGILIHEADSGNLKSIHNKLFARFLGGKGSPGPVSLLADGDIIEVGDIDLKVIHTPGHSAGSICIFAEGNIFTGDTLFTEGMGRTDLPGGSYSQIMESIRGKILSLPESTIIWPGHNYGRNPSSTVAEQKTLYN
jgi:glyoxylase-like metal-dependent hydrolase (beta-lactamase superfamily II)